MKKCPFCGQEVEDNVFHCPKCFAGIPHEDNNNSDEPVEKLVSRRKVRS